MYVINRKKSSVIFDSYSYANDLPFLNVIGVFPLRGIPFEESWFFSAKVGRLWKPRQLLLSLRCIHAS